MLPVLLDNARLLAAAYRNLSAAQNEFTTEVRQEGLTLTLSSWKCNRMYRNSLTVEVKDVPNHDRYVMELRDITALMATNTKMVVQTDQVTWEFKVVEDLEPVTDDCSCRGDYWMLTGQRAPSCRRC